MLATSGPSTVGWQGRSTGIAKGTLSPPQVRASSFIILHTTAWWLSFTGNPVWRMRYGTSASGSRLFGPVTAPSVCDGMPGVASTNGVGAFRKAGQGPSTSSAGAPKCARPGNTCCSSVQPRVPVSWSSSGSGARSDVFLEVRGHMLLRRGREPRSPPSNAIAISVIQGWTFRPVRFPVHPEHRRSGRKR